jgi:hypothetical protein
MKIVHLIAIIIVASVMTCIAEAQGTCKVLNNRINSSYTGTCKKGLADGKGEAVGVDQYKGEFKKGLPDGIGIYIWQTGEKYVGSWKKGMRDGQGSYSYKSEGQDTIITGLWKEDKYIGERELAPYVIKYRNNITRINCIRMGDQPPYVLYKFSRQGGSANDISGLLMQGSSGDESVTNNFTGFERVTFPFEGKVKFSAPNAFNTVTINCELQLVINQAGSWTVTIYY